MRLLLLFFILLLLHVNIDSTFAIVKITPFSLALTLVGTTNAGYSSYSHSSTEALPYNSIRSWILNKFYRQYSKIIPFIGKRIVGTSKPYECLVSSIEKFYNQEQLLKLIEDILE